MSTPDFSPFIFDYPYCQQGGSLLLQGDSLLWLKQAPPDSIHAIVTDPPYGLKEYQSEQLEKRAIGQGGIWRLPPNFDGHQRAPLPRFTALSNNERLALYTFFQTWAGAVMRVLRPGAHLFIASNSFLSQLTFSALVEGGLEFRGQLIRLVQTLRGGDRPKNAEKEFPHVSSLPRGAHEPWGIFRKPLPKGMTVSDCLRAFQTGGLRRQPQGTPLPDVLPSERTSQQERRLAPHPSLKPQAFLRQVVYSALPLGEGLLLDPFMGSGSTIAAAEALGLSAIGLEISPTFYALSLQAVPRLKALSPAQNQPSLFLD